MASITLDKAHAIAINTSAHIKLIVLPPEISTCGAGGHFGPYTHPLPLRCPRLTPQGHFTILPTENGIAAPLRHYNSNQGDNSALTPLPSFL